MKLSVTLSCLCCLSQGRCAFTLNAQQLDSSNSIANNATVRPYAWGRTGQAPAPGSTSVWDRDNKVMVNCTPEICPFAVPLDVVPPGGGPLQRLWVNRAPVMSACANTNQDLRTAKLTGVALRVSVGARSGFGRKGDRGFVVAWAACEEVG